MKICCLPQRKKGAKGEADDASESTHKARSEKHRKSGRGGKRLGDSLSTCGISCAKVICDSDNSRRFPLSRGGKMCCLNELIQEAVWKDERMSLRDILHSDCLCALCSYWLVLLYCLHGKLDVEFYV